MSLQFSNDEKDRIFELRKVGKSWRDIEFILNEEFRNYNKGCRHWRSIQRFYCEQEALISIRVPKKVLDQAKNKGIQNTEFSKVFEKGVATYKK